MDFDRIKHNLRFRSGRTSTNVSKLLPSREHDRDRKLQDPTESPDNLLLNIRRKAKIAMNQKLNRVSNTVSEEKTVTCAIPSLPRPLNPISPPITNSERHRSYRSLLTRRESDNASSGEADYDLRPPSLSTEKGTAGSSLETQFELLYSEGYLRTLTNDPTLLGRFTAFLDRYKPDISQTVLQYLETQKVLKAVSYANAVASSMDPITPNFQAAEITAHFKSHANELFITLLHVALPAWITYNLVKAATSCLLAEVTNQTTPLTRNLVRGLSEVFCLTDPNRDDNPIIYASQEFYRLTGYGHKDVIGFNCRFLQGPKTDRKSVERLGRAIKSGEETSEVLLNYRRDGKPFVNVLMLAPLLDDKGKVKYFLGAQLDASRLLESGRGVDGFEQFLTRREMSSRHEARKSEISLKQKTLEKLRDLSLSFDLEESAAVQTNNRRNSIDSAMEEDEPVLTANKITSSKRVIIIDEGSSSNDGGPVDDDDEGSAWNLSHDLPSGKLPATYKKYFLVRSFPSLRIIFASRAAKKMGDLVQHPFLSHIAAPSSTLSGLKETFETMTPVTAKVVFMAQPGENKYGTTIGKWRRESNNTENYGESCWISATPLFDSEGGVGVWMIVIVDDTSKRVGRKVLTMDTSLRGGELPVVQSNGDVEADYSPQKLFQLRQQKSPNKVSTQTAVPGHERADRISSDDHSLSTGTRAIASSECMSSHRVSEWLSNP